jgi:hypothetical protein
MKATVKLINGDWCVIVNYEIYVNANVKSVADAIARTYNRDNK